jgi:hypothetical protein
MTTKSHQQVGAVVAELKKNPHVKRVFWSAVSADHFLVEVTFVDRIISYEMLSSTLRLMRDRLGQQSVSRFYDFSAGVLRIQLTMEHAVQGTASHRDREGKSNDPSVRMQSLRYQ